MGADEIVPTDAQLARMSPEARLAVGTWLGDRSIQEHDDRVRSAADRILRSVEDPQLAPAAREARCRLHALALDAPALAEVIGHDGPSDLAGFAYGEVSYSVVADRQLDALLPEFLRRTIELGVPGSERARSYASHVDQDGAATVALLRRCIDQVTLPADVVAGVSADPPPRGQELDHLADKIAYARSSLRQLVERVDQGGAPPSPQAVLAAAERSQEAIFSAMSNAPDVASALQDFADLARDLTHPSVLPLLREHLPEDCRQFEHDLVVRWEEALGDFPGLEDAFGPVQVGAFMYLAPIDDPTAHNDALAVRAVTIAARDLAQEVSLGFAASAGDLATRWSSLSGDPHAAVLLGEATHLEQIAELQGWDDTAARRADRGIRDLELRITNDLVSASEAERAMATLEAEALRALSHGDPRPTSALLRWASKVEGTTHDHGFSGNHVIDELVPAAAALRSRLLDHVRALDPEELRALRQLEDDPFAALVNEPQLRGFEARIGWSAPHRAAAQSRVPAGILDTLFEFVTRDADEEEGGRVVPILEIGQHEAALLEVDDPAAAVALLDEVNRAVAADVPSVQGAQQPFADLMLRLSDLVIQQWGGGADAQQARATAWMVPVVGDALRAAMTLGSPEQRDQALEQVPTVNAHIARWTTVLDEVGTETDFLRDHSDPVPFDHPSAGAPGADLPRRYREALDVHAVPIFRARVLRDAAPDVVDARIPALREHVRTVARQLLQQRSAASAATPPDLPATTARPGLDALREAVPERSEGDAVLQQRLDRILGSVEPDQPHAAPSSSSPPEGHLTSVGPSPDAAAAALEQVEWALEQVMGANPKSSRSLAGLQADVHGVRGLCKELLGDHAEADQAMRSALRHRTNGGGDPSELTRIATTWADMLRARGSLAAEALPMASNLTSIQRGQRRPSAARRARWSSLGAATPEAAAEREPKDERPGDASQKLQPGRGTEGKRFRRRGPENPRL